VTSDPDGLPGLSLSRLTGWLDRHQPGLRAGTLRAAPIAGGRSNLTYQLSDDTHRWALRRPPLGHVLPTAHDMAREFRVISALGPTDVPVPTAVALCTDHAVLGEPFYLMSFVDGVVLDDPGVVESPSAARAATEALVDTLVTLHAIEPAQVGLADFGRPDGFVARQVRRWHEQFSASVADGNALEEAVVRRLSQRLPDPRRAGVVHGDYRLTNVLFRSDLSRIEAVVDWEMATLGDPLTDVGLLYVYHHLAGQSAAVMAEFPSAQGFLGPDEMVQRYATSTGTDLSELNWYIAFGYFKLAAVAAGIDARYRQGKTVGAGFDAFGPLVHTTLDAARARLGGS
jgi:aminoglycoside phosphotransferase (APT) family kinase protein